MPLTECPKCGGKVSTRAVGCPHCKKETAPSSSDVSRRDLDQFIKKGDDTYVDPGTHELGSGPVLRVHDGDRKRIKLWGSLKDGRFHGPLETYDKTGQLKEKLTYKDGVLDGPYEYYHPNGRLEAKGNYDQGRTLWNEFREEYTPKGNPVRKRSYKDGEFHGPYEDYFSGSGGLSHRGTYKDGVLDGLTEAYRTGYNSKDGHYEDRLYCKMTYQDGKRDGLYEEYHQGELLIKGAHKDGKLHGSYEKYTFLDHGTELTGDLFEKGEYNMGKKCGEWTERRMWLKGSRKKNYPPCPPDELEGTDELPNKGQDKGHP